MSGSSAGNDERARRILALGTYDAALHPRVRVLIEGLRQHGFVVNEVNHPLGLSTNHKVQLLRQPWRLPRLALRLLSRWSRLAFDSLRYRGSNAPGGILVGYMGHFDVLLARALFPRRTIVLDHLIFAGGTALDRGERQGLKTRLLDALDRAALRAADIIVVDTDEHRRRVPEALRDRTVIAPVGAPAHWFVAEAERRERDHSCLRVVFFGLFTPLQGTTVVADAIRRLHAEHAPVRFTLVGSGQDADAVAELIAGCDVEWRNWVAPDELPRLVAAHDVCLGIFGTNEKARSVVPNKVYQGAAAGCAVVTSDTSPQQRMLGEAAVLVPAGDAAALAAALQRLAADPDALHDLQTRARAAAEQRFRSDAVVLSLVDRLRKPGAQ